MFGIYPEEFPEEKEPDSDPLKDGLSERKPLFDQWESKGNSSRRKQLTEEDYERV